MVDVMTRVASVDIGDSIQQAEALLPGAQPILEKLLAEDPAHRFSRGSEVGSALKELLISRGGQGQRTASMMTAIDDLSSVTAIAAMRPRASHNLEVQSGPRRRQSRPVDEPSLTQGSIEAFIYEEPSEVAEESFIFEEFISNPSAAAIQPKDPSPSPPTPRRARRRTLSQPRKDGQGRWQTPSAPTRADRVQGAWTDPRRYPNGLSSFNSAPPSPSHELAPAPPEPSSSIDPSETPRSVMTETLRAPNATDYGEDDLWSDAPAMAAKRSLRP